MSAIALLDRRGGCATKKYCEATTVGTDGVVVQTRTKYLNNHPVRSLSMLRDFFDVAATPPVQEGQCPVSHFIYTFYDRAFLVECRRSAATTQRQQQSRCGTCSGTGR